MATMKYEGGQLRLTTLLNGASTASIEPLRRWRMTYVCSSSYDTPSAQKLQRRLRCVVARWRRCALPQPP